MKRIKKKQIDGMAVASLILGIPALLFGFVPLFGWGISALALIFGIVSLNRFRHNKHLGGKGIAIAGTALGSIGLFLGILLMFFIVISGDSDRVQVGESNQMQKIEKPIEEDLASVYRDLFDDPTKTDLQKQELWYTYYKDAYILGRGYVRNVNTNIFGTNVVHADRVQGDQDIFSDFVVFFKDSERDKLLRLHRGQRITFKGKLDNYHDIRQGLDITEAELVR